ncbi:MAG: hypothetical protein Q7R32_14550, partial [Dehalococcoidia bacterium]|nr:hypothetical protein [Dehalococcoidia bacterium]
MSGKGKRRREARRRSKQRQEEQQPAQKPQAEGGPEPAAPPRQERPAAREEVAHSGGARKKARRRAGLWQRVSRMRISGWMIGLPVVVVGAVVVAVLILTSGSSGTTSGGDGVEVTPDPRVAGKTPDNSISLNVDDVNFSLTNILGKAGEVIEFLVTNTGTQSHNMVVAGPDNEYDTADDFNPAPFAIKAG